ncbi:MAG: 16S rRNA (guanine(966)-N(2))-methyltransferase RsmD [Anaerolineales bacterium]|jgi:16S rRNA (guanine966-N2)-methyltransferase
MSGLRIIAGKARGRKLRSVPGDATRPITDRVKENLFNILGADVQDSTWLDLFAGTGSVGIEALSRGADFVRFNDLQRQAVDTIHANLRQTGLQAGSEVLRQDAFHLLTQTADRSFDYVYIAPPQYKELWQRALLVLDEHSGWLNEDAWVIVQIHPVEYQPVSLKFLEEFDRRKYGSTLLIFYRKRFPGDTQPATD